MVCQFYERHGKKNEAEKTIQNLAKTHADKLPLLVKLAEMKLQGTICMKQRGLPRISNVSYPKPNGMMKSSAQPKYSTN